MGIILGSVPLQEAWIDVDKIVDELNRRLGDPRILSSHVPPKEPSDQPAEGVRGKPGR
jgi:hypothetical protein